MITERPLSNEYDDYFERYVQLVPAGDLIQNYARQMDSFYALISNLTESESEFCYEEGKWSIKEVVGHLSDAERMLSYIMFRTIRGDSTIIPGINLGDYVIRGEFHKRTILDLLEEWKLVRQSTLFLIKNLRQEDLQQEGIMKNHRITVLASACILLGHTEYHINILHERYHI